MSFSQHWMTNSAIKELRVPVKSSCTVHFRNAISTGRNLCLYRFLREHHSYKMNMVLSSTSSILWQMNLSCKLIKTRFRQKHTIINVIPTCALRWPNQLAAQDGQKLGNWGFRKGSIPHFFYVEQKRQFFIRRLGRRKEGGCKQQTSKRANEPQWKNDRCSPQVCPCNAMAATPQF